MNLDELQKECLLRLIQVSENNISCYEGENLIKEAFKKFKESFADSFRKTIIQASSPDM